ncbi:unnamed protein product [Pieris macdunnoughi]|uniref:Uncharacterized protein n=1 Tax=Pieris macdunnoughi TaxID=345717 RepID=A0A821YCF6_9NEOP|nr:unnamed protein product [Pieris macdunnoughi]
MLDIKEVKENSIGYFHMTLKPIYRFSRAKISEIVRIRDQGGIVVDGNSIGEKDTGDISVNEIVEALKRIKAGKSAECDRVSVE